MNLAVGCWVIILHPEAGVTRSSEISVVVATASRIPQLATRSDARAPRLSHCTTDRDQRLQEHGADRDSGNGSWFRSQHGAYELASFFAGET